MEKRYYYIIKLNLPLLLKMLRPGRKVRIAEAVYIEITWTASVVKKLLRGLKLLKFRFRQVEARPTPAGPVLNLATVRNDQGKLVSLDYYNHVLKIRGKIAEQLKTSFANYWFFKDKTPISMILSCYGLRIAQDITPAVCFAYYARWRKTKEEPDEKKKNILVLQGSMWKDGLQEGLKDFVDEVSITGKAGQALGRLFLVKMNIARALVHLVRLSISKLLHHGQWRKAQEKTGQYNQNKGKIMVTYRMGIDKEKRNDLPFYHSSQINFDRLLIFIRGKNYVPTVAELEWIQRSGATCISGFKIKNPQLNIPTWKRSVLYKQLLLRFCKTYLKTVVQCIKEKKRNSLWMLDKFCEIEKTGLYWKDFFLSNNVKILVNSIPSDLNFISNNALSEIGGMAVEFERSIRFDYCTYIHNSPNHIYFATGPYSLTQTPEPSFSLFTVQTGGMNLSDDPKPLKELETAKQNSKRILTVFDEYPNEIFLGSCVREMYEALIELVNRDPRFFLLLKTKKPQVLDSMADIAEEISRLSSEGKCLVLDWKVSPFTAVANGELVVSVISTAAFESALLGARTIMYYPMRAGCSIFYSNNGLNRRIFEEPQKMIAAIQKYADKKDNDIGDCSDIVPQIDPFGDNKGAERMGKYLEWCLQNYDNHMKREKIIENTNQKYAEKWGKNKITSENSYEAEKQ